MVAGVDLVRGPEELDVVRRDEERHAAVAGEREAGVRGRRRVGQREDGQRGDARDHVQAHAAKRVLADERDDLLDRLELKQQVDGVGLGVVGEEEGHELEREREQRRPVDGRPRRRGRADAAARLGRRRRRLLGLVGLCRSGLLLRLLGGAVLASSGSGLRLVVVVAGRAREVLLAKLGREVADVLVAPQARVLGRLRHEPVVERVAPARVRVGHCEDREDRGEQRLAEGDEEGGSAEGARRRPRHEHDSMRSR